MSEDNKSAPVPRLRFSDFSNTKGWEQRRLNDALQPLLREVDKPKSSYIGLGVRSHGKGTFQKPDQAPEKNSMDKLFLVHRDDLIVSITFAWEGAIAIANNDDHGCYVSHRFPTYTFKSAVSSPAFFRYVITDKQFVYKLGLISPGGAGRNRVMNKSDFLNLPVLLPSLPEQQKIADCLSSLDELITVEIQKLDALKTHKKGLMQQLFPRAGETVPRLRFPEFREAGEWSKEKLRAIATLYKGKGISKADIIPDGVQPCIRYGELYTIYGEVIHNVASSTNVNASDLFLSKKNDVIIPASGETKIDIAKASCVMHDDIALGGDLNVIRSNQNGVFLSYQLNGPLRLTIARVAQGDTVVHLYPTQIEQLDVLFPNPAEQQRIADCLSSLDDLVTVQGQKIDALKTHKKGLMQQLFPVLDEVQE